MFKKKVEKQTYDRERLEPVIRISICTGEQTAGFQDVYTGRFREVMLIRTGGDLEEFLETYGLRGDEIKRIY